MKKRTLLTCRSAASVAALVGVAGTWILPFPLRAQEVFQLHWQESGIHEKAAGYRPHSLLLKTEAPPGLKQAPAGLAAPVYGVIEMGPPKAPAKFLVMADAPGGKAARLFVDGNANGDFTDDPACTWTNRPYQARDGSEGTAWNAEGTVTIPFASGPRQGKLKFYAGPARAIPGQPGALVLYYYTDYGLAGDVKIGGQTIPAVLDDAGAMGHFRLGQDTLENPILWLGIKNPITGRVGLSTPAQRPFEVDGKWWAMTNLTLDGAFQIAAASKPAPREAAPAVDLSPGKKAPAFTGKLATGKTVKFPNDYKGKVVLLDFWATWCGPCVAEIPNVVQAYEKYHEKGFEVLGISLDKEDSEQKLAAFTKKKDMPWPQVYDGKFWQAEVAKLYGINSIPHMLLVDGDTGVILADKTIRGEALAPAIEKALASKK
jgi:peroxiredoxin